MRIGAAILLISFHLAKVAFSQEEEPFGYEKRELGRLLADGGVLTEDDKQALLEVHNTYRSNTALGNTGSQPMATDMLEMVWDENLAISSKDHVDKCVFEHGDSGNGENIYTAASSIDNVDNIDKLKSGVKKWYDEQIYYNFDVNDCDEGKDCGHYTQVVWSSSASVGCGYAECGPFSDDLFEVMLVCQYSPPGNYVGEKPYTSTDNSADIASQCPVEFYSDSASGLCKVGSATTNFPTASPTSSPTVSPTASPTSSPAASPTASPAASATEAPTTYPMASPTSSPTASPTSSPTASPTASPAASATEAPTASPTASPTSSPTASPTSSPTVSPTASPTTSPTASPTSSPTSTASPTASLSMFVAKVDVSIKGKNGKWKPTLKLTIKHTDNGKVRDASISYEYRYKNKSKSKTCETNKKGLCNIKIKPLKSNVDSVIVVLKSVTSPSANYNPELNFVRNDCPVFSPNCEEYEIFKPEMFEE